MAKLNGNFVRNTSRKMDECSLRIPRVTRSIKKKKHEKARKNQKKSALLAILWERRLRGNTSRANRGNVGVSGRRRGPVGALKRVSALSIFSPPFRAPFPRRPASVRRRSTESCYRWEMKFF